MKVRARLACNQLSKTATTILGDLYDELIQTDAAWVGLVLCSTLSPSTVSSVDTALGKGICGQSCSLVEVAAELSQHYGRGVLLIDTLDLVINRDFVPGFRELLLHLMDCGVTVVFTCRDHEYGDYLEPVRERLPGLSQSLDRYTVPDFSAAEIRLAAETFFHQLDPQHPEQGHTFADNILALSADSRSLQEIIQNPLLLALLCDLFAKEGQVPPDLTVSKLYQRYWQEKVRSLAMVWRRCKIYLDGWIATALLKAVSLGPGCRCSR
jgi:hypothetical protein